MDFQIPFIGYKAYNEDSDGGLHTLHRSEDEYVIGGEYVYEGDRLEVGKQGFHFASNPVEPVSSCFSRSAPVFKILVTGEYTYNQCGRRLSTYSYILLDKVTGIHIVDESPFLIVDGIVQDSFYSHPELDLKALECVIHTYEYYSYSNCEHLGAIRKYTRQQLGCIERI
jgi:hypothetical protein